VIKRPVDEVWETIRHLQFSWNRNVTEVKSVEDGKEVGVLKQIRYRDDTVQTIKIVELSDLKHVVSWDVVASEPAVSFLSVSHSIRLTPITTEQRTFMEWDTHFSRDATPAVVEDARFKQQENFEQLRGWFDFHKVAVFVDGSEQCQRALNKAVRLKKPRDKLFVVHCPQPVPGLVKGIVFLETLDPSFIDEATQGIKEGSRQLVESYKKTLDEQKVTNVEAVSLAVGNSKENAVDFLAKRKIDTAFVGTRGHGIVAAVLVGSFSRYLAHHAPCSVVVVN